MDNIWILLGYSTLISLVFSSLGFFKTVWFISIGYTASIVALCVATYLSFLNEFALYNYIQITALSFWGLRLGGFLVKRERNQFYKKAVADQTQESDKQPIGVVFMIWISVSILYVMMFSPALFSLQETSPTSGIPHWIIYSGVVVMILGFVIESLADAQKSYFKKANPNEFCNRGLYRWVRYPNYLGEILIWTGNTTISLVFLETWWQWVLVLLGWICILLIMMGSTKRLEKKQKERYGKDPLFDLYSKNVPVLFPWVPIYSLEKVRVYLE